MNDHLGAAAKDTETKPNFWYQLPHGYLELDFHPSEEGVAELSRQVGGLPQDARDRADQTFRLYALTALLLRNQPVAVYALGMHPGADGQASLSVLTISAISSKGANPVRVLAGMVTGHAGDGSRNGLQPVELPSGIGFLTERVRTTVAPGVPPEGRQGPLEGTVWQGTVAVPEPRTSSIVTVQMVTSSVGLADDYRSILLGTARTLTFTDPTAEAAQGTGPAVTGSAGEAMKSDFG
ncbi:hypothetical protein [Streptomyces ziwulingensis]|uniref:Uncharacterized protein n=1 Tax=Streptomyces ziwulingensis TaxID=1045501 RepID=A0ABP9AZY9_9ACTN